jgi:formylglycine-generating enzyme
VSFLNANDPTGADPLGLFNIDMYFPDSGVNYTPGNASGSKYSVVSGYGNDPVYFVTWFDAIRFANWMDNGQPIFTTEPTASNNATENGSYKLDGFTPTPSNGNGNYIARNPGATIFLPSENEWYKAAYYNPATSSYFLYPTSSNTAPTASAPTATPNSANYNDVVGAATDVGAYSGTTSPYGAYDMAGDVYQWNDTTIEGERGLRGGALNLGGPSDMQSTSRGYDGPTVANDVIGFRLAMVPEPSSVVLALVGCAAAFALRKRLR